MWNICVQCQQISFTVEETNLKHLWQDVTVNGILDLKAVIFAFNY